MAMPGSGDARPRRIERSHHGRHAITVPARLEYLAERPGQALKPWQIAKGVSDRLDGQHVGVAAVTNVCLHEAARGRLVQIDPAPMTFAHPARADSEAGQP